MNPRFLKLDVAQAPLFVQTPREATVCCSVLAPVSMTTRTVLTTRDTEVQGSWNPTAPSLKTT